MQIRAASPSTSARDYRFPRIPRRAAPGYFDVLANSINIMQDHITRTRFAGEPPHGMLLREGRRLIGPFAQVFWARLPCQCHQSTAPIASAAIEIKATIRAEASIHAAAGTLNAMMSPRRQICQERI